METDPEIRPTAGVVPNCTREACPAFDGKRCRLTGFEPDSVCEPAVIRMAGEIVRLSREPLTTDQIASALREGAAERRVAEGDNAWASLVADRDQWKRRAKGAEEGASAILADRDRLAEQLATIRADVAQFVDDVEDPVERDGIAAAAIAGAMAYQRQIEAALAKLPDRRAWEVAIPPDDSRRMEDHEVVAQLIEDNTRLETEGLQLIREAEADRDKARAREQLATQSLADEAAEHDRLKRELADARAGWSRSSGAAVDLRREADTEKLARIAAIRERDEARAELAKVKAAHADLKATVAAVTRSHGGGS